MSPLAMLVMAIIMGLGFRLASDIYKFLKAMGADWIAAYREAKATT